VILGIGYFLFHFVISQPAQFGPSISWYGIVPGRTTIQEAFARLGSPDGQGVWNKDTQSYHIYGYSRQYEQLNSQIVELWTEERGNDEIIVAIFRRGVLKDISSLKQLVADYQRPDKISWHYRCGTRFLVWAQKGIGVQAFTYSQPNWDNPIGEVLLFEPMSLEHFLQIPWPYHKPPLIDGKIFSEKNPCTDDSPNPDFGAEDPYDWQQMPPLSSAPTP
jgi:hypothetical protein